MDILVTVQTKNLFAVCHFLLISFRLSEHTLCSLVSLLSNKATQVSSIQERCMSLHSLQTEKKNHLVAKFQLQLWSLNEITP